MSGLRPVTRSPHGVRGRLRERALAIADIVRGQHGVICQEQAAKGLGMSRSAVARRLASGQWIRVLPGVFVVAESPDTADRALKAAQLWGGEDAALSHRTALQVHGLQEEVSLEGCDVTSTQRRSTPEGLVHHRTVRLPEEHVTTVRGTRVTTVQRTLVDLAFLYRRQPDEVQRLLDACVTRGLVDLESLGGFVWSRGVRRVPGARMLRRALASRFRRAPRTVPDAECQLRRVFRRRGVEVPEVDARRPQPLRLGYGNALVLEIRGFPYTEDPVRVARTRQEVREHLGEVVGVPHDVAHRGAREVGRLVQVVRAQLAAPPPVLTQAPDMPRCDVGILHHHIQRLNEAGELPACLVPYADILATVVDTGFWDSLSGEVIAATQELVATVNAMPA